MGACDVTVRGGGYDNSGTTADVGLSPSLPFLQPPEMDCIPSM